MSKSTILKAVPVAAILLAPVLFAAGSGWGAKPDADVPDTMATEFLWTPAGARAIADEVDTMATEFLWVPAGSGRK